MRKEGSGRREEGKKGRRAVWRKGGRKRHTNT